ncbi:17651_t:CDS:2, partial [Rhizophagus irregularis]
DYHDIHEKRRPDTVTLSTAKHMATCICKQVSGCAPIPIIFNNVSVHNPVNIDASNICFRLIREYHGIFDIAYTNRKKQWLTNGQLATDTFDQIELLTVHCYDDAIAERKEERSMKGVRLIGFQEKNLHSLNDYITALQMILDIDKDTGYLQNHIAPLAYPYKPSLLNILAEKTSLFLLDYFQRIYKNCGKSKLCKSKKKIQCQLATLGETVDTKCLPTGYSTNMPPLPDSCDHCRKKLDDGEVLICGHGYHFECYQMMEYGCRHCEEYYKRGIYSNVNSFLDRLEKGPNVLTSDEQDETPTEENETVEEVEANGSQEVHAELLIALIHVNTW